MRIFSRQDLFLIPGVVLALVVIFVRPIHRLLDLARDVEVGYGLALVPGLLILAITLLLYQQAKRQEIHARAAAAAAAARQAGDRVRELERLVTFGQSLGRALDFESLGEALRRDLPRVAGSRKAWVLVRREQGWERLAGEFPAESDGVTPEELAERALAAPLDGQLDGRTSSAGHHCFPLQVGDATVGVLGVRDVGVQTANEWQVLAATAALLGIAIRNVQLFLDTREHSLRDALTGCFNRAHALEVLDVELRRSNRSRLPLSILMFDLDEFKQINDRHGHLCGDALLAAVGRRLKEILRTSDVKCRYGGEEFLVVLPDTPMAGAMHVAEGLRREIADLTVAYGEKSLSTSASFGVASAAPGERNPTALIARADAALYQAKRDGRNCVRLEEGMMPVTDAGGSRHLDGYGRNEP